MALQTPMRPVDAAIVHESPPERIIDAQPPDEWPEEPVEEYLPGGRPIEDRSFEAVETVAAAACGLALGGAVAGPIGAAVGVVLGGSAGVVMAEAVERAIGRAAETTDAEETESPHHR